MDVVVADLSLELRLDAVRLGDLLGGQPLTFEHVQEVGVSAKVQLIGPFQPDAAVLEQPGQDPVHDGGAHLGLDVVADDRNATLFEAAAPVRLAGKEYRHAIDEGAAGVEDLLGVPLHGFLAADRKVVHDDVGPGLFQDADDISGRPRGLGDDL